jgi:uncharacterized integral membrane protein (TIGR00697 family)
MSLSLSYLDVKKLGLALTVYLTSLIAANTLGLKLMPFLFGTHLSVSVFSFPLVFIMTDLIGEAYGKEMARMFVLAGVATTVLFMVYTTISLLTPWSESSHWLKEGYLQIFQSSLRISIASIAAFLIGEYQDVFLFFSLTKRFGHKWFWLRSNLSNLWSQWLDTVIFMVIAFAGVYPPKTLILIIIPWWLYKVCMGILYTPLSYLGLWLLQREPRLRSL